MRIIAASQNKHKLVEINAITKDFGMELVTMRDAGLGDLEIEENGATCEENSLIKAETVFRLTGEPVLADDTGLCVDALGGAPGVHSARYSGVHGNDDANRATLLKNLEGIPPEKRTAHFVCVITMIWPDGRKLVAKGICEGSIATEERGDQGFGYDRLFIPKGYDKTFAQLGTDEKNQIGHRHNALVKLREMLEQQAEL